MSFNNHLSFNVSKASPTTSTTNTNTTSTPQPAPNHNSDLSSSNASKVTSSNPNSLSNNGIGISSRGQPDQSVLGSSSPKFGGIRASSGSEAAATIVTVGDGVNYKIEGSKSPKPDLKGIFNRFDISRTEDSSELTESTEIEKSDYIEGDEKEIHHEEEKVVEKKNDEPLESSSNNAAFNDIKDEKTRTENSDSKETISEKRPVEEDQGTEANHENKLNHLLMTIQAYDPFSSNEAESLNLSGSKVEKKVVEGQGSSNGEEMAMNEITEDFEVQLPNSDDFKLTQKENTNMPRAHRQVSSELVLYKRSAKRKQIVDPKDQYEESHKPFNFQNFLNCLKDKRADPIVRYIRSFLVSFTKLGQTFTPDQKIKIIADFKEFMNDKFTKFQPFASMDEVDLENSREGLEKLIMNRLYEHCYPPEVAKHFPVSIIDSFKEDLADDESFYIQLHKFSWIRGPHLDVQLDVLSRLNKGNQELITYAVKELNKINHYRAPRDKIICLLNACKIIFSFLKASDQETNADAFIPILILVVLASNLDHLVSNFHYIENFRGEEWLNHGETSYYLSSLQGAIDFIFNINYENLSISKEEYDNHIEEWESETKKRGSTSPISIRQPAPIHPDGDNLVAQSKLSPSNVLLTSAEMVTKSISNLWSPSPQAMNSPPPIESQYQQQSGQQQNVLAMGPETNNSSNADDDKKNKATYKSLREVFPNLDKDLLKDVVYMNKGNIETSIDACLQLVNET